jgi:hypothetical protein
MATNMLQNQLPLCSNDLIHAFDKIHGKGAAFRILRERLKISLASRFFYSEYSASYWVELGDKDRYGNHRVGSLEARAQFSFITAQILKDGL